MTSQPNTQRTLPRCMHHPLAFAVALALNAPFAAHAAIATGASARDGAAARGAIPNGSAAAMAFSGRLSPVMANSLLTNIMPAAVPAPPALNALPTNPHNISVTGSKPVDQSISFSAPTVTNGTTTLTVTQTSRGAVVDWDSFDIGKQAAVNIVNPSWKNQSVMLNRVTGPNPSQIFGKLTADGSVFLINPAGITFAAGSSTSVGGLVASTLDYDGSDAAFIGAVDSGLNAFSFVRAPGAPLGVVRALTGSGSDAAANITASNGGIVAMLGDDVVNGGTITANQGKVAFGSGNRVTLDFQGDGLTMLSIDLPDSNPGLVGNLGTIQADGGQVVMRLDSQQAGAAILGGGTIRARSLQNRSGKIILSANAGGNYDGGLSGVGGTVEVIGNVDASAASAGVAGGSILLQGERLAISGDNVLFNAGGNGAANGSLTLGSSASVLIAGKDTLALESSNADLNSYSLVLDSALGNALSNNTNVTLNANGEPASTDVSGAHDGSIWFMSGEDSGQVDVNNDDIFYADAQIAKTAGGNANLVFNANRDIRTQSANADGSGISATSGALNVDLNADSHGSSGTQNFGNGRFESGGQVSLLMTSINTNGGSVRIFGQSDPVNGRATGSMTYSSSTAPGIANPNPVQRINPNGIVLNLATIDTCAGSGTCTGAGDIELRGVGIDRLDTENQTVQGGAGVTILGSTLLSGSGGIHIDGAGSTGAYGVRIDRSQAFNRGEFSIGDGFIQPAAFEPPTSNTTTLIQSQSGAIDIVGVSGNQAAAPVGALAPIVDDVGAGVGILGQSQVLSGGDLLITGQGANLTPGLAAAGDEDFQQSSDGIDVTGSTLQAGIGKNLTLKGTAGSQGVGTDPGDDDAPALPAAAVRVTGIPAVADPTDPTPAVFSRLTASGGVMQITGTGDMYFDQSALDVESSNSQGGSIDLDATNILLGANTSLTAYGKSGGSVDVRASNVVAMDSTASVLASAIGNGNGGSIVLDGINGLYAFGTLTAQAGASGGNGGSIETSGGGLQLDGLRVQAGAAHGSAGTWVIDPYDVTIAGGNGPGTVSLDPFVPIADAIVRDGEINYALDHGNNVSITTGNGGTADGNVTIQSGVDIQQSVASTLPLTFRIDANGGILGYGTFAIRSIAGPLNIVFDADAAGLAPYQGINLSFAQLMTNGGDIAMFGHNDPVNGYADATINGININFSQFDTRVGQSDANVGGSVSLRGRGGYYGGGSGVTINDTGIHTSTGDIDIVGQGFAGGSGVALYSNVFSGGETLSTTSGDLSVTGIGSAGGIGSGNRDGLHILAYALQTGSGEIDLRGHGATDNATLANNGILLDSRTTITSDSGMIQLSGSSDGSGAGVGLVSTYNDTATGLPYPTAAVSSRSGNIVVRAHNNGSTDALVLDGTLASGATVNLRPGGLDANGNLIENAADAIALGGALGFGLSTIELNHVVANDLVLGSDIQAGAITVSAPATYGHNLTLDSGSGDIAINGALNVGAHTLALIGAGDVTQSAPITARSLLAQSRSGSIDLANAGNNVSSTTLAGSAADNFTFVNAGTVGIGNVSAVGFGAATNAPTTLVGAGIVGNEVLVHALTGDMILGANVSGADVDLVSAGVFDNINGSTISASGDWRVWGNSWSGETRGGLAGNGNLPNLYGCTFGAACTSGITVPTDGNHFIYTQRPTLTVDIGNATREYGLPNGALNYTVSGLILGDQAMNAASGSIGTSATQASDVGSYLLNGTFVSAAGYRVAVDPGMLAITPATLTYVADPYSRLVGTPNGLLGGTVTGFRNGDTLATDTSGTAAFQSPAGTYSPLGTYAINGSGLSARNYTFVQASGNTVALTILPPVGAYTLDIVRDTPVTYVYDRNFGIVGLCPATDLTSGARDKDGDTLAREWSRVRSRPNLANCVSTKQKNSCGDF
jgi:filamentous hemagglutinin family protein